MTPIVKLCLCSLMILTLVLTGCGAAAPPPTDQDTIAIYQTAIRAVYGQSAGAFSTSRPAPMYVLRATNDAAGDPSLPQSNSVVLAPAIQDGIASALADLHASLTWVDDRDQIRFDQSTGQLLDGGVLITLGNILYDTNTRARIPASLYYANLGASGRTYVLEKQENGWRITGTTGAEWISQQQLVPGQRHARYRAYLYNTGAPYVY